MKRPQPLVFVLWGHYGDEVTAVTLVVTLRRSGQRVKLVGLDNRTWRGANGLSLVPDLMLSEALSLIAQVRLIILCMEIASLQRYLQDPRMVTLLQSVVDNRITLLAPQPTDVTTVNELATMIARDVSSLLRYYKPIDPSTFSIHEVLVGLS